MAIGHRLPEKAVHRPRMSRTGRRSGQQVHIWQSRMPRIRRATFCRGCTTSTKRSFAGDTPAGICPGTGMSASSHRECLIRRRSANREERRWQSLRIFRLGGDSTCALPMPGRCLNPIATRHRSVAVADARASGRNRLAAPVDARNAIAIANCANTQAAVRIADGERVPFLHPHCIH